MSITNILMSAAGASTVLTGWIAKLDSSGYIDAGRSVAIDSSGNVYITGHSINASSVYSYLFIAKYNSTGALQWQRKLDTTLTDTGYGITVDTTGNVYIVGQGSANSTASYLLTAKYDTNGIIQWQRRLDVTAQADSGYNISSDTAGNIYVTGIMNASTGNTYVLVAKYDTNGSVQWQRKLDSASTDYGYGISVGLDGFFVVGTTGTSAFITKYNTDGVLQWNRLLYDSVANVALYGVATDTLGNAYVTGMFGSSATGAIIIAKYNTDGLIQWQQNLSIASQLDTGYSITSDSVGNTYIIGQANASTIANAYTFIAKYNTNGILQWCRKLDTASFSDYGYGIAVDAASTNIYITGQANTAVNSYILTAKLPANGTVLGTGIYTVGGSVVTYADISSVLLDSAGTASESINSSLVQGSLSLNHWISQLDSSSAELSYGIAVDSLGNSYAIVTTASTDIVITLVKYNAAGTLQWQKSLNYTAQTDTAYGITVDSSNNIYITGQAYATTATLSICFIVKFDTGGNTLWQRSLDTIAQQDIGYGITTDISGNVYLVGQSSTVTAAYIFVIKCDSSGVLQWQRSLDVATNLDIGRGITVDSSSNVYVVGQANATTIANAYVFIVKYNSSGVMQWQRKLESSTTVADIAYGISNDGSNIYVVGQANTAASSYVFTVKYDTDGNVQWQRALDIASQLDVGYAIASDSSGNSYITGQVNATTVANSYIFVAKYNTSGVLQWQLQLDSVSAGANIGTGITIDTSNNVYITGQANTATSTCAFVAKLLADGSLLPSTSLITMSLGTIPEYDASAILLSSTPTGLVDSSAAINFTDPAACWQNTLTSNISNYNSGFNIYNSVVLDSSNNIYTSLTTRLTGTGTWYYVIKTDNLGNVQWCRQLLNSYSANSNDFCGNSAVSPAGNVYITGVDSDNSVNHYQRAFVVKLNTSGTVQWKVLLNYVSSNNSYPTIVIDSSENIYLSSGYDINSTYISITKLNSSGGLTWTRRLTATTASGIALDTANNVYVTGMYGGNDTTNSQAFLTKYDTGGNVQWLRTLGVNAKSDCGFAVACDSNNNVYMVGGGNAYSSGTTAFAFIAKYDSTGAIQWQRTVEMGSTYIDRFTGISIDASDNIYVLGYSAGTQSAVVIIKYDISANIQWQRRIDSASNDVPMGIKATSDFVYITANIAGNTLILYKLPASGAIIANSQVTNSTFTSTVSALVNAVVTPVDAAGGGGISTSTITDVGLVSLPASIPVTYGIGIGVSTTLTATTTLLGIPESAAALTTGDSAMTPTTLTLI